MDSIINEMDRLEIDYDTYSTSEIDVRTSLTQRQALLERLLQNQLKIISVQKDWWTVIHAKSGEPIDVYFD